MLLVDHGFDLVVALSSQVPSEPTVELDTNGITSEMVVPSRLPSEPPLEPRADVESARPSQVPSPPLEQYFGAETEWPSGAVTIPPYQVPTKRPVDNDQITSRVCLCLKLRAFVLLALAVTVIVGQIWFV